MRRALLVGWREFRVRVGSRGFLLTTLLTPSLFLFMWLVQGRVAEDVHEPLESLTREERPRSVLGLVDPSGMITRFETPLTPNEFRRFDDASLADQALRQHEIPAYVVIPADYPTTGKISYVSLDIPTTQPDADRLNWLLLTNLLPNQTAETVTRLRWPFGGQGSPNFVNTGTGGTSGGFFGLMLPFLVTIAIMVPLFTSGSFLLQSVLHEKSSRTLEILLVSLRPRQLLFGKLLGIGLLTTIQYAVWLGLGALWIRLAGPSGQAALLQTLRLTPLESAAVIPFALGGFLLYASLMAGLGALAPDMEGSRAWVFIISLPMMVPIYLWTVIVGSPNSILSVVISLFPFSAPVAMLMRMTSTVVPLWQLGLSLVGLAITGFGVLALMARLFRVQTMLSGEPLSFRRFVLALLG